MECVTRRVLLIVGFALLSIAGPSSAQVDAKTVAGLRALKATAEESVLLFKKTYSENSSQYVLARKKYMVARSEVEGLLGFMKQALLTGTISSVESNAYLKEGLVSTQKASKEFFEYVDGSVGAPASKSTAAIAAVASAVSVVLDIIKGWGAATGVQASITDERRKAAADLEKDLAWRTWAEIFEKKL
jgi:hypothetical protein